LVRANDAMGRLKTPLPGSGALGHFCAARVAALGDAAAGG
jgi:hypothetical protein